ncbi:lysine-specific demethylase rbr-2 [Dorcoceras hygrometricum]|uniref:Lysine-specific demethylase rbr-2 n=1 Tax=Dorcoceras hygrometricum TaxID=472368 RepID=A0A2Z7CB59_9LAMI|nr:lysine-specific demethylase rbr-2 [Dorcoceras hygrometricum]
MAASFYSNSVHVDFESVLAMGEPGMVSMFQALIASGLQGFLGCPAVVYEDALVEFFANGTVRDGLVVSSVNGVVVEISEEILFSILKKMVSPGSKQAKGFAIQISLLLESVPNLELGESSEFPSSKILTDKTIQRYIAIIDKSGEQEPADAPKVKRAPKTKVASKKRPADFPLDVPVLKKKRTSKKKSPLEIVVVAQEAIPILSVPVSPAVAPMTLCFNEFRKNILAQNASIFVGLADVRKEVQEVNAKVDITASRLNDIQKDAEATKEALSHQLFEFQSQAQENQNILHSQLSELVDYIHLGGADKKGESGSRGPQQTSNVQI